MADQFIQVPADSTGKKVDVSEIVVGANTVERQRIVISADGTAAALASVDNTAPAGSEYGVTARTISRKSGAILTTTALGISGVFTQAWQDSNTDGATFIEAAARADQASAASGFIIQETDDSATANFFRTVSSATTVANTTAFLYAIVRGRYWRVQFTNSGTAQTSFELTATATNEVNLQGDTQSPLRIDPTGTTTQPVSGTVTANAGTGPGTAWKVDLGSTTANATAVKVDNSGVTQPVSGTVTANQGTAAAASSKWPIEIVDSAGTNVATVKAASTAIAATDLPLAVGLHPTSPLPTGTNTIGALTANQSVNNAQVAGAATVTAAAGVQKVGIVGNAGAIIDGATAAAVPANVIYNGTRGTTALPTAVTDGQLAGAMADKFGRTAVVLNSVRDVIGTALLNSSSSTAVTFIAAGAAGVFNDIITYVATNESATATIITLSDGTNLYKFAIAANGGIVINFPTPVPAASAATAWTVLNSAAVAVDHMAVYAKNK